MTYVDRKAKEFGTHRPLFPEHVEALIRQVIDDCAKVVEAECTGLLMPAAIRETAKRVRALTGTP